MLSTSKLSTHNQQKIKIIRKFRERVKLEKIRNSDAKLATEDVQIDKESSLNEMAFFMSTEIKKM